ncbi:MAG: aminopeptidase [bacterium]|nr:aminopeptidase [bacterium]
MSKIYQPPAHIIQNYADVLINYALNSGSGVKPGEVVECAVPDVAKPLALALQNVILEAGAMPMIRILPTEFDKAFFDRASAAQLTFFPREYLEAKAKLIDHQLGIIADVDPEDLKDVPAEKIIMSRDAKKEYRDWLQEKETKGKFTWTIGLWGVQAKADTVGLTLEEYWQQIINACFLDAADPIKEWQKIATFQREIKGKLNSMEIDFLTVKGADADITVKLGANRIWQAGSGRNIPSFEFFTSPDWRGTNGWIRFNQPVYRYGNMMQDVYLQFKDGVVVEATAKVGNKLLQEMLRSPNANKAGEFSLTDKRMSRITHVMAETLFDENIGGPYGNTHLALGMAYKDCYRGDASCVTKVQWEAFGYNDAAEHTDIISTTDRVVTATLMNGSSRVIYADGQFQL